MPFEKGFKNEYHELEQSTKYRFAEIEISYALKVLYPLYRYTTSPRMSASTVIFRSIAPPSVQIPEMEDEFYNVLQSTPFNVPQKTELIKYFIMKGHSYNKIRDITHASYNTIAKYRYGLPYYQPIFRLWNDEMLNNWNDIKRAINIFNEDLAHAND